MYLFRYIHETCILGIHHVQAHHELKVVKCELTSFYSKKVKYVSICGINTK
jgi:hypothetical protein